MPIIDASWRYLRVLSVDKIGSMFEAFGRARRRTLLIVLGGAALLFALLVFVGVWYFSSGLMEPSWQMKGIRRCEGYRRETFGPSCGNLAENHRFKYVDV